MLTIQNFINSRFADAHSRATLENIEPATGLVYSKLPDSGDADINAAALAAQAAFPQWSRTPASERARSLTRIAELIERDLEKLARAESIDSGKPIKLARAMDIPRAAANFRFFAGAILHSASELHRTELPVENNTPQTALNYTLRQPLGVVALISPWNLPLYLLSWKIAPAIACGNTCICKPSELTPMTAHLLAQLIAEAELPPGVVNIVHGSGSRAGAPLTIHPLVKAISFTGGTTTGAAISRAAAPLFKKLSLELGGKNPTLIFDDADLDAHLPTIVRASFTNQGQVCLCGSRIFVHRAIEQAFTTRFVSAVSQLKLGDPLDESTDQGALISAAHLDKVRGYITLSQQEGAEILLPSASPTPSSGTGLKPVSTPSTSSLPPRCSQGFFHPPTILANLAPTCRTQQEEIFGPVVTITPFDTEDQAIEYANCTPYGLAASVFTQNLSRAHRVAEKLHAGMVWINCWLIRDLRVPFGGTKNSGLGREGGDDALRFFTDSKNVCIKYQN